MEIQLKCCEIFLEIDYLTGRLSELGREGKVVLGQMVSQGVNLDLIDPLLAKARKAEGANVSDEVLMDKVKEHRRCKWWNRGFCREREGCAFNHPQEDCQDHLKGRCTTKGCTSFRHRKVCRFFSSEEGCLRGDSCAYLHKVEMEVQCPSVKKVSLEMETQTERNPDLKENETQTDKRELCVCKEDFKSNQVHFAEDKVICILKRAMCSDGEWEEYEEKVESEMELEELLEDLGKVLEATQRLAMRNNSS
jgi:hypothetical protein